MTDKDLGRPLRDNHATQQSPSLASRLGPSGECQAQLLELAERCEHAISPSNELGEAVLLACGWRRSEVGYWLGPIYHWSKGKAHFAGDDFRRHNPTNSIDVAITLVPEGLTFGCGGWDSTGRPWAWVGRNKDAKDVLHLAEGGATPALAICAAALRAHAASADTHPKGGDEGNTSAPFMSGAVPPEEAGDAQNPTGSTS